jgi:hypothetical protein
MEPRDDAEDVDEIYRAYESSSALIHHARATTTQTEVA